MIFDYVIDCPPYAENSAGIRALHYLGFLLQGAGYNVASRHPNHFNPAIVRVCDEECARLPGCPVAIYPDCIGPGNPFGLPMVVRFMFAPASWSHPGFFGGGVIPKDDCVFIYDKWLFDDVGRHYAGKMGLPESLLTIPCVEPDLFFPEEKTIEKVVYIGKAEPAGCFLGNNVITRKSHSRKEAASLLRRAKHFYTLDHYTMMAQEAALCGCETWKMGGGGPSVAYPTDAAGQFVMRPEQDLQLAHRFSNRVRRFFSRGQSVSNRAAAAFQSALGHSQ